MNLSEESKKHQTIILLTWNDNHDKATQQGFHKDTQRDPGNKTQTHPT